MVPIKRRFNNKPIGVKSKALKDLEKGMTSKGMAEKYCVLKNTVSSWVKNKYKLTTFFGMERYVFFFGLLENEAKKFQPMESYLKEKP